MTPNRAAPVAAAGTGKVRPIRSKELYKLAWILWLSQLLPQPAR